MFSLLFKIILGIILLEGFILIKGVNKNQDSRIALRRIFLWQILNTVIIMILVILEWILILLFPYPVALVGIILLEGFILIKGFNKNRDSRIALRRIFLWQILSPVVIVILVILEWISILLFPPGAPELGIGIVLVFSPYLLLSGEALLSSNGLPLALYTVYTDTHLHKKRKILFTCLLICTVIFLTIMIFLTWTN